MDYNNNDRNDRDRLRTSNSVADTTAKKSGVGIGVVVAIVIAALVAFFLFNNGKDDTARVEAGAERAGASISQAADTAGEKVKDAAAEVPQALDDATTAGDQKTTRPNDPDSTDKLDQK